MENNEKKTPCLVHITDESTVTLTHEEYMDLVDSAVRFNAIAECIRDKIDSRTDHYRLVDEDMVLLMTGMEAYYARKQAERKAAEVREVKDE